MPVHYGGQPCRMDELLDIARRHNLLVIEDAAHAVGAPYRGKPVGSIGDATAFSFYVIKNMTTGEGGMVTTNNDGTGRQGPPPPPARHEPRRLEALRRQRLLVLRGASPAASTTR